MNALALLTFIAVFSAFESSLGAVFSPRDLVSHHIAKRQTTANDEPLSSQDIIDCVAAIIDHQCGTSGYTQQTVNIALGCRNESYARNSANACARNENGESCGVATVKFLVNDTDMMNAYSCSDAVASQACPVACQTFLESVNSKLGCCINTYLNTTDSPLFSFYNYGKYFDHRLWSLCDVPLPATGSCENMISLDPPPYEQDCTEQELVSHLVDYQCNPSIGQPLVNAVLQNERCNIFATGLVDVCATNANGQVCAEAISLDILGSISTSSQLFSSLTSLSVNCLEAVNVDICSPFCQSAITNITDSYGCCVNAYNNSETGMQLPLLSYSLWNSCGVDSPGFCNSSLTTSHQILPPTSNPLTTSNDPTDMYTPEEATNQGPSSPTSPSTLEFDTSTSSSRVLAPVNWIVALLLLKLILCIC